MSERNVHYYPLSFFLCGFSSGVHFFHVLQLFCLFLRFHLKNAELEELVMAILGAIHNLSFYHNEINTDQQMTKKSAAHQSDGADSSLTAKTANISSILCAIYQWSAQTIQAEIARVLGNLTRSTDARQSVQSAGGIQFLLKNVSSTDVDMVATSCGVLVNMLGDWQRRATFRDLNGPLLLRNVLRRSAEQQNWILALIVCQVSM